MILAWAILAVAAAGIVWGLTRVDWACTWALILDIAEECLPVLIAGGVVLVIAAVIWALCTVTGAA